jgi:hypothetical protein
MTVNQMAAKIISVYPNEAWRRKVNRMNDDQIIAIYFNFLDTGKFDKKPTKTQKKNNIFGKVTEGEQLSFF